MTENPEWPTPAAQAHFAAVGRVSLAWGTLELFIDAAIGELTNLHPDVATCLTGQLANYMPKLRAFAALIDLRLDRKRLGETAAKKITREINSFITDADGLARQRNRVVHDLWVFKEESPLRFHIVADKRLDRELRPHSTEEVLALAGKIDTLRSSFTELFTKVYELLGPLPGRPQP